MTVISRSICLALMQIIFALGLCSVATGSESFLKFYPLPTIELKTVISDWLLASGFEINYSSAERGQVNIAARKGQEAWQLALIPHSPLATKITVITNRNGQAEPLYSHISEYLRELSFHSQKENRQLTIPSAVMSKTQSVVCIKATAAEGNLQFSGFAIDGQGVILCTAHNLKGHSRVNVILHDGTEIDGQVVRFDVLRDLAIVLVRARLDQFVDLRNGHNRLGKNERLFSVGCPMNVLGVIQPGILSGPPRRLNGLPLWQVDMAMQPGSSGSPVFDAAGNLVGMVKGRYRGTDSLGFLIPFETLVEFVKGNGSP